MAEQRFTREDLEVLMGKSSMEVDDILIITEDGEELDNFSELVISFSLPKPDNEQNDKKVGGMFG